jgi:alanine racemase
VLSGSWNAVIASSPRRLVGAVSMDPMTFDVPEDVGDEVVLLEAVSKPPGEGLGVSAPNTSG